MQKQFFHRKIFSILIIFMQPSKSYVKSIFTLTYFIIKLIACTTICFLIFQKYFKYLLLKEIQHLKILNIYISKI